MATNSRDLTIIIVVVVALMHSTKKYILWLSKILLSCLSVDEAMKMYENVRGIKNDKIRTCDGTKIKMIKFMRHQKKW